MHQTFPGIPDDILKIFAVAWLVSAAYIASLYGLIFRLNWLLKQGRAPGLNQPLKFGGLNALRLLFTNLYREIDDPLATRLTWAARALFVLCIPLYAFVVWSLIQTGAFQGAPPQS